MSAALAHRPAAAVHDVKRVADVFPNPDQPRQTFDQQHIEDLWLSIEEEGLLQPISVTPRPKPDGSGMGWMIVAGECRWRAHVFGGAEHIECLVHDGLDDQTVMVLAILENARRKDVTPLEEAVAFQKCLDRGMTEAELAKRLGTNAFRIRERTCLLNLRPEYQTLLRGKNLGRSEAYEMAQLDPVGQDRLFKLIRAGACPDYGTLRAQAMQVRDELAQGDFFGADHDKPTDAEKRLAKGLEARFAQTIRLLRSSVVDNEVVAVKKISPDRASSLADQARVMQAELGRIEQALRGAAPKLELVVSND